MGRSRKPPPPLADPLPPSTPDRPALPKHVWYTPDEVAESLDVSPITVREWINVGVLVTDPASGHRRRVSLLGRKVGGRWKVPPENLEAFIAATSRAGVSEDATPATCADPLTERKRQARIKEENDRMWAKLGR